MPAASQQTTTWPEERNRPRAPRPRPAVHPLSPPPAWSTPGTDGPPPRFVATSVCACPVSLTHRPEASPVPGGPQGPPVRRAFGTRHRSGVDTVPPDGQWCSHAHPRTRTRSRPSGRSRCRLERVLLLQRLRPGYRQRASSPASASGRTKAPWMSTSRCGCPTAGWPSIATWSTSTRWSIRRWSVGGVRYEMLEAMRRWRITADVDAARPSRRRRRMDPAPVSTWRWTPRFDALSPAVGTDGQQARRGPDGRGGGGHGHDREGPPRAGRTLGRLGRPSTGSRILGTVPSGTATGRGVRGGGADRPCGGGSASTSGSPCTSVASAWAPPPATCTGDGCRGRPGDEHQGVAVAHRAGRRRAHPAEGARRGRDKRTGTTS